MRFLGAYLRSYLAMGNPSVYPLFAAAGETLGPRSTTRWLWLLLGRLEASPPLGSHWTGKSLRSGSATAATAIGVLLPAVAACLEHQDSSTTVRYYLDARVRPSPAAWEFFGRYISAWDDRPAPGRQGG